MLERGPELGRPAYEPWANHPEDAASAADQDRAVSSQRGRLASAGDVAEIFGDPGEEGNFVIGSTREQDHPVCINLDKFVQRSAGIFGATGSGKSFLTRIILAGLIEHNAASVLVFDMHNEYGFDDTPPIPGSRWSGLKSKFRGRCGWWPGTQSTIRGQTPDLTLRSTNPTSNPRILNCSRANSTCATPPPPRWTRWCTLWSRPMVQRIQSMVVGSNGKMTTARRCPHPTAWLIGPTRWGSTWPPRKACAAS